MEWRDKTYIICVHELAPLHKSMKKFGATVDSFEFVFDGVRSSALFFTNSTPFRVVFYKHGSGQRLELNVLRGYKLEFPQSMEEEIASFFEIPKGGRRGRLFVRIASALGEQAPCEWRPLDKETRRRVASECDNKDEDKIYFCGLRVWPAINAQSKGKVFHRTEKNLKKVKLLDPLIYEDIKDLDISVCYTADPSKALGWHGLEQMMRDYPDRIEDMRHS